MGWEKLKFFLKSNIWEKRAFRSSFLLYIYIYIYICVCVCVCVFQYTFYIYIYIYIYIYSNTFIVKATGGIRIHPDCHSCWISKMQSGHEDTLEERYAIKFCFKLGKMPQKRMECFRLLFDHLAWIEHQFLSGIRASMKAGSLWEMMRGIGGVRKSKHQSWLAKGWELRLLYWGFKGVQEEIQSEEASTLQIGSVAFPPGQCTSPQLHPCHRLFDQDGHQHSSSSSLCSRPCSLWLLVIP